MAEEFVNRLKQIEQKVDALGGTLKRMITILTSVTEMKSQLSVFKDEIINAVNSQTPFVPTTDTTEEITKLVKEEIAAAEKRLRAEIEQQMATLKGEIANLFSEMTQNIQTAQVQQPFAPIEATAESPGAPEASAAPESSQAPLAPSTDVPVPQTSSLPPDKSMKVADELDVILKSLRMGCKAGDVLETMAEAKMNITKFVSSDPIMIKIDKWVGLVSSYPKRNELKAKDVMSLKKEIRAEIAKYRPA